MKSSMVDHVKKKNVAINPHGMKNTRQRRKLGNQTSEGKNYAKHRNKYHMGSINNKTEGGEEIQQKPQ